MEGTAHLWKLIIAAEVGRKPERNGEHCALAPMNASMATPKSQKQQRAPSTLRKTRAARFRLSTPAHSREGINGFPVAYQVVVKCTFGDLLMITYEYCGHKTLQKD